MFIPIGDDIQRRNLPIVPLGLILLNVLVYAYQTRTFVEAEAYRTEQVVNSFFGTWGLTPQLLAEGQVMGLLSHMFVHGDFFHLLGNMIVLWTFACTLEAGLGSAMLLAFYVVWGVGAGLVHVGLNLGDEMPLVGASGAIAGLMGAYTVAYGPHARIKALCFIFFRPFVFQIPAFLFGIGWIVMQMWHASNDPQGMGGVAWFAHIGGFGLGAAMMYFLQDGTEAALVRDRSGKLIFEERVRSDEPAEFAAEPIAASLPDNCPHCGSSITDENILSPVLARCGNQDCKRLVYPDRLAVTA